MFGSKKNERIVDHEATRAKLREEVDGANQGRLMQLAYHMDVDPVYVKPLPKCCDCGGCCPLCCECAAMGGWHTACHRCAKHCQCDRPHFGPTQVRCCCQVRKGHRYIARYSQFPGKGNEAPFTAISDPFVGQFGEVWVKTRNERGYEDKRSLGDCGVVAYAGYPERWNKTNWLEYADKRDIPGRCCDRCACPCYVRSAFHPGVCLNYERRGRCSSEPNQDQRVNHGPRQVRSVCQVVKGRRYRVHMACLGSTIITVTSDPYPGEGGGLRFDAESVNKAWVNIKTFSFSDLGITRYTNGACSGYGGWSPYSWLEFVDTCYACQDCPCGCCG